MSNLSAGSTEAQVKNPEEDKFEEEKNGGSPKVDPKTINVD
jgi:hypothetical protein